MRLLQRSFTAARAVRFPRLGATGVAGRKRTWPTVAAILGLTVLGLDALLSPAAAVSFLYAVPIFLVGLTSPGRLLLLATGIAFSASAVDFATTPDSVDPTASVLNSGLAAILIGISAVSSWILQHRLSAPPGTTGLHAHANDIDEPSAESLDDVCFNDREISACPRDDTEVAAASVAHGPDTTVNTACSRSLAESEKHVRLLLDRMSEGIFGIDADGISTFCNPACAKMLGYDSCDELLHLRIHNVINHSHADKRPLDPSDCRLCQVLQTGKEHICDQHFFWRADGTPLPVEYSAFPIFNDGKITGAVVTFRDITEKTASERRLREREDQLRHSQRMEAVGQLAGGVAHEFNNLLQTIKGFTRFAQQALSPEVRAHEDLEHVLTACERAAALTRQLLNFSRRDAAHLTPVAVQEVLDDLADMLRSFIPESVELRFEIRDGEAPVYADPGLLQQVLTSLCINAQEAMRSAGTLRISSQKVFLGGEDAEDPADVAPGEYVQLSVSDTGTGIPEELQERIFEPFFTTKEAGEGAGLGLATVFGIVQQHHGFVRVESKLGEGAAFHVYLPLHKDKQDDAANVSPAGSALGGNELILVAEDNPMVRRIAVRLLENAGYRTLLAADGEEAVEQFSAHADEIDMLLLDLVMPTMGGKEAATTIRLIRPDIPVAFCTGYDATSATIRNQDMTSTFVVEKPFDNESLLQTIRAALDNGKEQREVEQHRAVELPS